MSVFKKQTLTAQYPAFNVFKREATSKGFVNLTAGEILILKDGNQHKGTFEANSVVSYALEYNECPLAAVARAKENHHELIWINSRGAVLTAHHRDAENVIEVEVGMQVCFQGVYATIEKANNGNLKFKPV